MRWTYDATAGALYVALSDEAPVRQEVFGPLIADTDADGGLVGVEYLGGADAAALLAGLEALKAAYTLEDAAAGSLGQVLMQPLVGVRFTDVGTASTTVRTESEPVSGLELV